MKEYKIDISQPTCWNHMIEDHIDEIKGVMLIMKNLFTGYMTAIRSAYTVYKASGGVIMYEKELEQIAKLLDISALECLLFQLTYEMCSACTSAILNVEGEYVHFRTMDWDLKELAQLSVKISVHRGNKHLYDAITWAGCVGIFTGIKRGKYTVALNYRRNNAPSLFTNVICAFSGFFPSAFCIRHVLESDIHHSWLKKVKLIAPAYYTIMYREGDKVNGHVIIRDRTSCVEVKKAPVVQTNCDNLWDGINIVHSFERLKFMIPYTKKELTKEEFDQVLNQGFPIINDETIYRCVMKLDGFSHIKVYT